MEQKDDVDTVELPAETSPAGSRRPVPSARVQLDVKGLSHPGKVRPNNEDHFLVARCDRTLQTLWTNLPPGDVPGHNRETVYGLVVADGMGGEAAGEVASRKAITVLVDLVLRTPDWIMVLDEQLLRQVNQRMERRFRQIHDALNEQTRADPNLFGMGTTMTLAVSHGADLLVTHVGDSRAYLFRQDKLTPLTHDQTAVQELMDSGKIRPEEAATHPLRNRLTGAISTKLDDVKAALCSVTLADGDWLLLCTDGLTEMVPEAVIAEVLRRDDVAANACASLVEEALERGGKDNVTVVLARYHFLN
jgi:serine/threonine protein phosphatase PrpC